MARKDLPRRENAGWTIGLALLKVFMLRLKYAFYI
jgi:hypothetical protein